MITDIYRRFRAPALPFPPGEYDQQYVNQLNNVLRIYFNQLDNIIGELVASQGPYYVQAGGTGADAFGRLRISEPYTLFDSQNRYRKDPQFAESTSGGGAVTYVADESTVALTVGTASGDEVVRQTYRVFPYQPGKSLQVMMTLVMNEGKTNLRQRVGYFGVNNGVFLQQNGTTLSFVLRTATSGSPSDARTVAQSSWNVDKLDGTGASGITLDPTKAQILWFDFEWLGVGSVRCGFIIDGIFYVAHVFNNANDLDKVYMTTAILPLRYEITNTDTTASSSTLKQICSTVVSEGGYERRAEQRIARATSSVSVSTTFIPIVSIRLASDSLGAVVLPSSYSVIPTGAGGANFEVVLIKNATLTGASWDTTTFPNTDYDVSATALSGGTILRQDYMSASPLSSSPLNQEAFYNFALQLGVDLSGNSDIYTLAARTLSGSNSVLGSLSFWNLTD